MDVVSVNQDLVEIFVNINNAKINAHLKESVMKMVNVSAKKDGEAKIAL